MKLRRLIKQEASLHVQHLTLGMSDAKIFRSEFCNRCCFKFQTQLFKVVLGWEGLKKLTVTAYPISGVAHVYPMTEVIPEVFI